MVEIEDPPRIGERDKQLLPPHNQLSGRSLPVVSPVLGVSRMYIYQTPPVLAVANERGQVEHDNASVGYNRYFDVRLPVDGRVALQVEVEVRLELGAGGSVR